MIKQLFNFFQNRNTDQTLCNVLACDRILTWLILDLDAITPCCEMPHKGELNISLYDHKNYEDIVRNKIALIKNINRDEDHVCRKCYRIKKYDSISRSDFKLDTISFSFDKTCNTRCQYCYMSSPEIRKSIQRTAAEKERVRKKVMELLDSIPQHSITTIGWTGGEPFLLQDFDAFYAKVLGLKAHTLCIYSNLTHYREVVIPRLHPNSIQLICSLDSGTPETYKKIKGRDLFHEVVENIKKYCSIEPDAVYIKYLFCDSNFSIAEVDSFFEVMQYCGVKKSEYH